MSFEPASGGPQTVHERKTCLAFKRKKLGGFREPKQKKLLQGDINTKYFQMVNGKRRKTRIYRLEQEERTIEGEEKLEQYVFFEQETVGEFPTAKKFIKIRGVYLQSRVREGIYRTEISYSDSSH